MKKITFKKITMLFLTIVSISSSLLFSTGIKEVDAACYGAFSTEVLSSSDVSPNTELNENNIDGDVTIQCSDGKYPSGWVNLRNTAKPIPSKSIPNWGKVGTHSTAVSDLSKYLSGYNYSIINYGSGKIRVVTPKGDIMLYPSSKTYGEPTIKWSNKEAIRYFEVCKY
ncbi:hypothetical protein [Caldibacillus thermoamylovorans]|nr:hypothetical protein [Caldibacillus thermoamylovorans]